MEKDNLPQPLNEADEFILLKLYQKDLVSDDDLLRFNDLNEARKAAYARSKEKEWIAS